MKMSMMKRIFALLLTVAMMVCALTACDILKDPNETTDNSPTETLPPDPPTTPAKKITNVSVVCGDGAVENFAAAELKWYLKEKNIPLSEGGYQISLTINDLVAKDGYKIIADENGTTIIGGNNRGLIYGVYSFLEKYIGVYFYSPDTVVVDKKDVMIGGGVLDEFTPAFEVLRNPWHPIEKLAQKDGGNIVSDGVTKIISLYTIAGTGSVTTCLSDSKTFDKALQNIQNQLKSGNVAAIRFSPRTEYDLYCTCEKCAAVHEEEGSPAGNYIRFLNKLYAAVLPENPNLKFEIVPVGYMAKAPSLTKPADGISIRFDTDKCHISHPLTDETCPQSVDFCQSLKSWCAFCDDVHVEYGLTASVDYIPVFANLGSLRENMRFFAECGIDSINFTGNIICPTGEFGELRVYLLSKLIQNPMMSEEEYYEHMNAFLKAFYGDGWTYIRGFIDKIIELAADGHQTYKDSPFAAITEEEYLANEADFEVMWSAAEVLAEDRVNFVKRARYQWRYIKLCLHPNEMDAKELIADVSNANIGKVSWRDKKWNVDTNATDFTRPPFEWVYKS